MLYKVNDCIFDTQKIPETLEKTLPPEVVNHLENIRLKHLEIEKIGKKICKLMSEFKIGDYLIRKLKNKVEYYIVTDVRYWLHFPYYRIDIENLRTKNITVVHSTYFEFLELVSTDFIPSKYIKKKKKKDGQAT
jgi:hypothetical protein